MKKLYVLMLMAVLFAGNSLGQPKFQKLLGGSNSDDASKIINTSDGGYATIGSTQSFGAGEADMLFIKFDSAANVLWAKAYGSSGNDFGVSCVELPTGGYVISGYTYGLSADTSHDDILVIRINSTGLVQWAKKVSGDGDDETSAMVLTTDANIVVAGNTTSSFQPMAKSAYALKMDFSGNVQWAKAFHMDSINYFKSVTPTPAGGVTLAGSTREPGGLTYDVYVVNASSNGTASWAKRYGGASFDYGIGINRYPSSDYVVAGSTNSYGAGASDAFLLKIGSGGNAIWLKTYGTPNYEKAISVIANYNNSYVFCGYMNTSPSSNGNDQAMMIKTDTSGTVVNKKTFGSSTGNSIAWSLAQTTDSGYIAAATTESFGAANGDIYLLKTNNVLQTGCYDGPPALTVNTYLPSENSGSSSDTGGVSTYVTSQIITTSVTTNLNNLCIFSGIDIPSEHPVQIFPNPASDILNIDFSENDYRDVSVMLKTINGQTIYTTVNSFNRTLSIPVENLSGGLYFLQITSEKGTRIEKIIILR